MVDSLYCEESEPWEPLCLVSIFSRPLALQCFGWELGLISFHGDKSLTDTSHDTTHFILTNTTHALARTKARRRAFYLFFCWLIVSHRAGDPRRGEGGVKWATRYSAELGARCALVGVCNKYSNTPFSLLLLGCREY